MKIDPQLTKMKKMVQRHYNLKREITTEELRAEIMNLKRKSKKGLLDDYSEILAASLGII